MPECANIHSRTSAIALKIFGADLSPNGSIVSMNILPCHLVPSNGRSLGCTGTMRYAFYCDLCGWIKGSACSLNYVLYKPCSMDDNKWTISRMQYSRKKSSTMAYMTTKQPQLKLKLKVQLVCIPLMVGRTFCTSLMTAALPASFSTRPPSQLGTSVLKGSIVAIVSPAACSCPIHTDGETSGCCVQ